MATAQGTRKQLLFERCQLTGCRPERLISINVVKLVRQLVLMHVFGTNKLVFARVPQSRAPFIYSSQRAHAKSNVNFSSTNVILTFLAI